MIKVVITTTMYMTPEQFKLDKVQEVLDSINSGEAQRELNTPKVLEKVTMSYWTDAKQKLK